MSRLLLPNSVAAVASHSQGTGFKGQFAVETGISGDLQELKSREELERPEAPEGPEGYQQVCFIFTWYSSCFSSFKSLQLQSCWWYQQLHLSAWISDRGAGGSNRLGITGESWIREHGEDLAGPSGLASQRQELCCSWKDLKGSERLFLPGLARSHHQRPPILNQRYVWNPFFRTLGNMKHQFTVAWKADQAAIPSATSASAQGIPSGIPLSSNSFDCKIQLKPGHGMGLTAWGTGHRSDAMQPTKVVF